MLLLLKVAEERHAEDLLLPRTFQDAALMATSSHPDQDTAAPPEDPFELTDGEDDMEWWRRTRKSASGNSSTKARQPAGRGRGRSIARAHETAKSQQTTKGHAALPSAPVVYMRSRTSRAKHAIPSDLEISSGELEADRARPSSRRVHRINARDPNDSNWNIGSFTLIHLRFDLLTTAV